MVPTRFALFGSLLAMFLVGCGGAAKEEVIKVKQPLDPVGRARIILERYAAGQPMGSEATSFPKIVADLRATDPNKAEVLEKGLEQLKQAPPASLPAKAKELLAKL